MRGVNGNGGPLGAAQGSRGADPNWLRMVTLGRQERFPEGQSRTLDAELADRQAEIDQLVGELGGALGDERSGQWPVIRRAGNALMGKVSEYLSKGGSFSQADSAQLIAQMVSIFHLKMDTLQQKIEIDLFHPMLNTSQQEIEIKAEKERSALLALRALDTALLLYLRSDPKPKNVRWMLDAIPRLPDIVAANPFCVYPATLVLKHFADCVADLPPGNLTGIIVQVKGLFETALDNDDPAIVLIPAAFRVLCAFAKTRQPDSAEPVLGALQGAIEKMSLDNKKHCRALATMLGDFAECVPSLPLDAEAYGGVIEQVKRLFDAALGQDDPDIILIPAAFRVLCAFAKKDPDVAMSVLDALQGAIKGAMAGGDWKVRYALATMLGDFAKCVPFLPLEACGDVIEQVKGLFNAALGQDDPAIVPAAFRVLCAFAKTGQPDSAEPVLGALQGAIDKISLDNDEASYALATMLRDFAECVPSLPLDACGGVIGPVQDLFDAALKWRNPDVAPAAFRVLCAFAQKDPDVAIQVFSRLLAQNSDVAMGAFSQALGMLGRQAQALGGKLAAINGRESQLEGEAKLEAYDEAMQLFEGYASTLAGCIGRVPAELRNRFIWQIKREFNVAYGQMQADGNEWERFAGMKVAHELLKLWGLLLLPPGSIDMVLDAVVEALNENGKYYFSCRGDDEWRRIHTKDPEVYGILARTDLALITGKVVELAEMTADTVMALGTVLRRASAGVGARICDSYTEVFCRVLGRAQDVTARVIAEMQQKLRMTGGRDNLMERIEEYIALARGALGAGAQVFGIGYQGYGKRGTMERRGNAATLAIGAPIALEKSPCETEDEYGTKAKTLVERFRAAIRGGLPVQQTPMATRSGRMGRPRIDDAVIDVITVIGTSHILTPAMVGTFGDPNDPGSLGLHRDARVLCNFLQITKESMIKRLNENDRQASLMLGEGLVKSPGVTNNGEFAEASGAFTGNAVRISEGLFREVFQLRNQLAEREEQLAAATASRDRNRERLGDVFKEFQEISNSSRSDAEKLKATTRMLGETMKEAQGSPPPSAPFARPRPPVPRASSAARALRSGETLLTLATFLTDCNRRDQDMWGNGWCGFYAILSQTDQRFAGAALATWNGAQGAQAAVMVLQQALRYGPWDQLDTERLQRVAQHTRRAVVLMDTMGSQGGYDVKQIDLAIPISAKEAVVLTVASHRALGFPFEIWLDGFLTGAGRERDAATVVAALGRYLPADVDINTCTVLDVIRGLLINPQTIGLSHPTANHFHALQPQGAGAWPEDQTR